MDKKYIYELCERNKISVSELEKTLNMSNGSLRKDGDIKSERLLAIAEYFDVSMEFLLKGMDSKGFHVDGNSLRLLNYFQKLNESQQEVVIQLVRAMLRQNEGE